MDSTPARMEEGCKEEEEEQQKQRPANQKPRTPVAPPMPLSGGLISSASGDASLSNQENGILDFLGHSDTRRVHFLPHWSDHDVEEALKKGKVFRASFRVNAYNKSEAYCTIDGVPTDVLISGNFAQNRAIEGDSVAIVIDPVRSWPKLKGSSTNSGSPLSKDPHNGACTSGRQVEDFISDTPYGLSFRKNGLPLSSVPFDPVVSGEIGTEISAPSEAEMQIRTSKNVESASLMQPLSFPSSDTSEDKIALQNLSAVVKSFHIKRPTGRVVAIISRSPRRNAIIGFLEFEKWLCCRGIKNRESALASSKKSYNKMCFSWNECIHFVPTDAKLPKILIPVKNLLPCIKERMHKGDISVDMELVAVCIDEWEEECYFPKGRVIRGLGYSGDIETQISAILLENAIQSVCFSPEALSCLPVTPWEIPSEELKKRKDLRELCVLTIDPSSATDLDDALSVQRLSDDLVRVGVHIADVSYFVQAGTALDHEAQLRSTSVYLLKHKVSMLPSLLSEDLGSLNPGVDRLAFSIIWDFNNAGDIIDHWIGYSVIRSCCKLSYHHAQDIIDGNLLVQHLGNSEIGLPALHGNFKWEDIIESIEVLHVISERLKENRFKDGALSLDSAKLVVLFDESGMPCDSKLYEGGSSCSLVEELMLLANKTTAKIICQAFPDCSLLRRHPQPNSRKLREFEVFCKRHGFELDVSSTNQLHSCLQCIKEKLKDDPALFNILVNYAAKAMQLAAYFCTGEEKHNQNEWAHYSLSIPFYTHFTSPLRRYPDIIVHRTLRAVLEAEEMYMNGHTTLTKSEEQEKMLEARCWRKLRCFSGIHFDQTAADSVEGVTALQISASKHGVPNTAELIEIAAHCNERKLGSRKAQEAGDKLYLWALVKRKMALASDARILGLGPKFMSVYIYKFAMERRIYYDEVDGLVVDWLESTSTLVLDLSTKRFKKRTGISGRHRALEDVAVVTNPAYQENLLEGLKEASNVARIRNGALMVDPRILNSPSDWETQPSTFPLTLRLLSWLPVVLGAVGGEGSSPDITARLYVSSYCE